MYIAPKSKIESRTYYVSEPTPTCQGKLACSVAHQYSCTNGLCYKPGSGLLMGVSDSGLTHGSTDADHGT